MSVPFPKVAASNDVPLNGVDERGCVPNNEQTHKTVKESYEDYMSESLPKGVNEYGGSKN